MKTKLTITIPSYRQPEMLSRALQALSIQTFKDFQVIILDDASGVDLASITAQFSNYFKIVILKNEKNLGAMSNMIKSILFETESDYVFSHHEDDFTKSNYLEIAIDILEENKNVSFVLSSAEWIEKNQLVTTRSINDRAYELFNEVEFTKQIIENRQFIFGSVIYRRSDLINNWEYDRYNTLCDRVFLIKILTKNNSLAAYIKEPSIFVRDHSLDERDDRSSDQNENHLIELVSYYRDILIKKYPESYVLKKSTNLLLLGYNNYKKRIGLWNFYKKAKNRNLISISKLDLIGLYSIATLPFNSRAKNKILKVFK